MFKLYGGIHGKTIKTVMQLLNAQTQTPPNKFSPEDILQHVWRIEYHGTNGTLLEVLETHWKS